jgi:hypothetical protein
VQKYYFLQSAPMVQQALNRMVQGKLTTGKLMHSFFLIMKYQSGLVGEVDEDVGIDAENQDTDYGDNQGKLQR